MKPFLPVLAYQKIGDAPKYSHLKKEWASARQLQKTINFLIKHGYRFITPQELQKKRSTKSVMLTFIGGYQSFYTDVFPLLQAHKICATLFVAVDTLGTYNSWQDPNKEPWQNIITQKQLKEMYKSGLVQIGTLGLDGQNLLEASPSAAKQALLESAHRLETLYKITPCAAACWPFAKDSSDRGLSLGHEINLPIITSKVGKNELTEAKFLRILHPGLITQLLLWQNK